MVLKPVCHAIAGLLLALALCPGTAAAQNTGLDYTISAGGTIASSLNVSVAKDLNFGRIFPNNNGGGGQLILTPNSSGEASYTLNSINLVSLPSQGEIRISGAPNAMVSIVLPNSAVALSPVGSGTGTAQIELTTDKPSNTFMLDGSGNGTVYVGGTLYFQGVNYGSMEFTGSFSVSVNYQ